MGNDILMKYMGSNCEVVYPKARTTRNSVRVLTNYMDETVKAVLDDDQLEAASHSPVPRVHFKTDKTLSLGYITIGFDIQSSTAEITAHPKRFEQFCKQLPLDNIVVQHATAGILALRYSQSLVERGERPLTTLELDNIYKTGFEAVGKNLEELSRRENSPIKALNTKDIIDLA